MTLAARAAERAQIGHVAIQAERATVEKGVILIATAGAGGVARASDLATVVDRIGVAIRATERAQVHHRAAAAGYSQINECMLRRAARDVTVSRDLPGSINREGITLRAA